MICGISHNRTDGLRFFHQFVGIKMALIIALTNSALRQENGLVNVAFLLSKWSGT